MTDNTRKQFYTPEEVANLLSVSTMTIYRAIKSKELGAVKFGYKNLRISKEDLDEFLNKHKTK